MSQLPDLSVRKLTQMWRWLVIFTYFWWLYSCLTVLECDSFQWNQHMYREITSYVHGDGRKPRSRYQCLTNRIQIRHCRPRICMVGLCNRSCTLVIGSRIGFVPNLYSSLFNNIQYNFHNQWVFVSSFSLTTNHQPAASFEQVVLSLVKKNTRKQLVLKPPVTCSSKDASSTNL